MKQLTMLCEGRHLFPSISMEWAASDVDVDVR